MLNLTDTAKFYTVAKTVTLYPGVEIIGPVTIPAGVRVDVKSKDFIGTETL